MTLEALARDLGEGRIVGDPTVDISGVSSLELATAQDLSFVQDARQVERARASQARALVVGDASWVTGRPCLVVAHPYLAFAKIMARFDGRHTFALGIHPTAVIAATARIGTGVSIGPFAVIGEDAVVEEGVVLGAGVYVGRGVHVGEGSRMYPQVTVLDGVIVGRHVVIHSGTVIGSDGFGYVRRSDGSRHKIPQLGTVHIEDDVEIGSNVSIDRATFGMTRVGQGTKIDNLVQVAHNDVLGRDVVVISQAGLSGSVTVGDRAVVAGQAGIADHVVIGEEAVVLAQAGVRKDIPPAAVVWGTPAKDQREVMKELAEMSRLGTVRRRVKELEARVAQLEARLGQSG